MVRQRVLPCFVKGTFFFCGIWAGFSAAPAAAAVVVDTGSLNFSHKVISEDQTRWRQGIITSDDSSTVTLTGSAVTITGPNADDFLLSTSLTAGIGVTRFGPGKFELAFNPESVGQKQAEVVITTDDPVTPVTTLTLTGEGLPFRGTVVDGLYTGYGPGWSTIGTGGNYPTLYAACEDVGRYPLTGGDWTFEVLSDLSETSNSLLGQYDTNGHTITFQPALENNPTITFQTSATAEFDALPYMRGHFLIGATRQASPLRSAYRQEVPTSNIVINGSADTAGTERSLSFRNSGGWAAGGVISILGDCDNVELRNCRVEALQTQWSAKSRGVDIAGRRTQFGVPHVADFLTIENCEILAGGADGCGGIVSDIERMDRRPPSFPGNGKGLRIHNNDVKANLWGIGTMASSDAEISNNRVELHLNGNGDFDHSYYGIGVISWGVGSPAKVSVFNNRVRVLGDVSRFRAVLAGIAGFCHSEGAELEIYNNMVSGVTGPGGIKSGITCSSSVPAKARVFHNSVYVPASGGVANNHRGAGISTAHYFFASLVSNIYNPPSRFFGEMLVKNNVVRVEELGSVVFQPIFGFYGFASDYNNVSMDPAASDFGYMFVNEQDVLVETLADWQANYGMDLHSWELNPFVPAGPGMGVWVPVSEGVHPGMTDLHFTGFPGFAYIGDAVGVAYDIDGEPRSATTPIMGADETELPVAAVAGWELFE